MRGSWWSWCDCASSETDKDKQLEMLSFNIDPQWCGLLFSVYCHHEKGGSLITGGQMDSFAYSIAGPPLDADLIAWAGTFGFEICSLSSTCDLIFESVKATGVLILLGFSGFICYKVLNVYWPLTWSSLTSRRRGKPFATRPENSNDNHLKQIKGEYFGPNNLSGDANIDSPKRYQESYSISSSPVDGCGTSGDEADDSDGSPCVQLKPLRYHRTRRNQAKTSFSLSSPMCGTEQGGLPRDESYDSLGFARRVPRDGSFDSTCSELSFDFSLPEIASNTNTIHSLDKLQHEIDSLKSNCLRMDEEFETIKCNRNVPGMSSLMKANTSQSSLGTHNLPLDGSTSDTLKQQKARACFAGLYTLTTIKSSTSSESLDWDSPKAIASPAKSVMSVEEPAVIKFGLSELAEDYEPESHHLDTEMLNSAKVVPQIFEQNRSLGGSEDELMENLEWDEGDIRREYPDVDDLSIGNVKVDEVSIGSLAQINSFTKSSTASPVFESRPLSQLGSSGLGSEKLAFLTSDVSSEESGCMDWERNQNAQPLWSESSSELSTPANENAPSTVQNIGPRVNLLEYASKEWQGATSTARTMLQGYSSIPQMLNLEYLRGIRGDNYCAIRAALFQTLAQGVSMPSGNNALQYLAAAMQQPEFHWLGEWSFANRLPYQGNRVLEGMEQCLYSLDRIVRLLSSVNNSEREGTLAQLLNSDPNLDLHLVEAVKLLMLRQAIELYRWTDTDGQPADDLPFFALLMFARDTSHTPRDLMNNHLHHVGNTAGLEQVEMFLLGYTLGVTLRVVRPKACNTDDFVSCYPDWNVGVWPQVVLIAEDDRHYNILVN